MKLVCEITYEGSTTLRALAASSNLNAMALAVKTRPGINKPFLFFDELQAGHPTLADFDLHPDWAGHGNVVTADTAKNLAMLQAMLASPPHDALTW